MAGDDAERREGAEERERAQAEKEIRKHLGELHQKGVVDLDAPVQDLIDVIQREYPAERVGAAAQAGGYWLVGDQGWCNHLT